MTRSRSYRRQPGSSGLPRPAIAGALLLWALATSAPLCAADAAGAPLRIVLPAQVVALHSALITAKVAGYLRNIPVDKGDQVKAGELIADLEVPELLADQLQYKAELDVAQRDYQRIQQAIQSAPDLVTPQQLDDARGRQEVAAAKLARIETLLNYARITAPFAGTITARYVDPGAFIPVPTSGNQQSAAIVSLMDFREVRIQIPIPETNAPLIRPGCAALITASSLPGRSFESQITRVSYALESNAHTMLAEIDMKNPDKLLQPGMYVTVQLTPAGQPPRR